MVTVRGHGLTDYARGGSAVEAVWIVAQQQGLAVQPVSPLFLYARGHDELRKLSPTSPTALHELQREFLELADTRPDESQVLVLRLCDAPRPSVRSRRRGIVAALTASLSSKIGENVPRSLDLVVTAVATELMAVTAATSSG